MTDSFTPSSEEPVEPTVFRDRRRIDPETGAVRRDARADAPAEAAPPADGPAGPTGQGAADAGVDPAPASAGSDDPQDAPAPGGTAQDEQSPSDAEALSGAAESLAAERLGDLQRLQAEYVNYRRRVERDAAATRELALAAVLESLLPVLDDIALARAHGDLASGPFAAIADKLAAATTRLGLEAYGEAGEVFDPAVHDALMQSVDEGAPAGSDPVVGQVLQPGYRMTGASGRTLRAARVAVVSPA